jgi:hypothetical protein
VEDLEGAVEHEAFNLNSGSQGALQDGQLIGSQISAGTGWPGSYRGDPTATPLSTATSLELKVLKMVEARQQVLEDMIRALLDHKIELAIKVGRLSKYRAMTLDERKREAHKAQEEAQAEAELEPLPADVSLLATISTREEDDEPPPGMVERDLSYQVSMPSPLRRSMGDLVTAGSNIAKTFDPNNTNLELSKLLLAILLGEALEVEDPAAAVERIFPDGYMDPATMAAMPTGPPEEMPGALGADGQQHQNPDNPYGAPMQAQPPEAVMQQAAERASDLKVLRLHARNGEPLPRQVQEAILRRANGALVGPAQRGAAQRQEAAARGSQAVREATAVLDDAVALALDLLA